MSNGVQIFVNMNSCIFLILLLGFVRVIFCSQLANVSEDEDVCPVTWFRRKRANGEYTRWRFNVVTTPEFIVKVLDDDATTGSTNKMLAVNIVPVTKRGERIVVGGAMVQPLTSPSTSLDPPRDYTRFVPPTTVGSSIEKNMYHIPTPIIPPIIPKKNEPSSSIKELGRPLLPSNPVLSVYRDESPPASPQFLPRGHLRAAPLRQYAPIAPVAFTRRITGTPLTPPSYAHRHPSRSPSTTHPSRTSIRVGLMDKLADLSLFEDLIGDHIENEIVATRTTLKEGPSRTTPLISADFFDDNIDHFYSTKEIDHDFTTKTNDELTESTPLQKEKLDISRKSNIHDDDKESNFLYNSDYKDTNSKKELDYPGKHDDTDKKFEGPYLINESDSDDGVVSNNLNTEENSTVGNKTIDIQYSEEIIEATTDNYTDFEESVGSGRLPDDIILRSKQKRPLCNMIKLRPLNFKEPLTLPEIVAQLKQWSEDSPVARWADITGGNLTTMDNPIYIIIVDDPSVGQVVAEKQNVLLIAGIQGRDHHSVSAAMYVLYQLIERSETHYDLLSKYRFWVIPVFNPDGYDYSMTFPHKRDWVKNLRQTWDLCKGRESCRHCSPYGIRCTVSPCYGVNLDRNFEYQWIPPEELRAEHPCGNLYAGTRQMSEIETLALSDFIRKQHMTISVFIAFKEGDVLGVMYPYSHTKKRRSFDQIYRQRASRAAAAAFSITGRSYIAGQTSEFLPLYAGGIEDWADGHLGIDNTYTIMMFRPTDTPQSKFLTERVIHEAYAAMDSLLLSSLTSNGPIVAFAKAAVSSLCPNIIYIISTSLASLIFREYLTRILLFRFKREVKS